MAKDRGQVRRVLQILSPQDQETLAILHNPPLMEELLRRQETLAEVKAAGLSAGVGDAVADVVLPVRMFPTAYDELRALPDTVQDSLLRLHLPVLSAAPQEGLGLTQLFHGLRVAIYTIDAVDYRLIYEVDSEDAAVTVLMIGVWASLEEHLEDNAGPFPPQGS
jgi:mRNA-degrading endonuclease RelE of RelBE toxin-antitoxin system